MKLLELFDEYNKINIMLSVIIDTQVNEEFSIEVLEDEKTKLTNRQSEILSKHSQQLQQISEINTKINALNNEISKNDKLSDNIVELLKSKITTLQTDFDSLGEEEVYEET